MTKRDHGRHTAADRAALAASLAREVAWAPTGDALVPFAASVDGATWTLRLNDFPDEPLYTLLIGGRAVGDFDDWPASWRKPPR